MAIEIGIVLAGYNHDPNVHVIAFGVNTLCLLLAVGISIVSNFNKKKHEGVSIVIDLKTGIKTSAIYALTIASFVLIYYNLIINNLMRLAKIFFIVKSAFTFF